MTRTVLIVEDTDLCRDALELSLTRIPGLAVKIVGTAEEALRQLGTDSLHEGDICALVTDLHLPAMDGFELIEAVRALPGPRRVSDRRDQRRQRSAHARAAGRPRGERLLHETLLPVGSTEQTGTVTRCELKIVVMALF